MDLSTQQFVIIMYGHNARRSPRCNEVLREISVYLRDVDKDDIARCISTRSASSVDIGEEKKRVKSYA